MINIRFDPLSLNGLRNKLQSLQNTSLSGTLGAMNSTVDYMRDIAVDLAPDKSQSGGIKNNITSQHANPFSMIATVVSTHPEGANLYNEFGTGIYGSTPRPYEIFPKYKKALSNINHRPATYDAFGPVSYVMHPGIPSRPFMRPAAIQGSRYIRTLMRQIMKLFKVSK